SVAVLLGPKMTDEAVVPILPFLATDLMHGVRGIVMAVIMMLAVVKVSLQIVHGTGHDLFNLLLPALVGRGARQEEDARAGGRAGKAGAALAGHIREPAFRRVITRLDVLDRALEGDVRNVDAGVLGGAQGHHLHDRDRDVGPGRLRLVAPAAL